MKVATLQDLVAADDPANLEFPTGFDYDTSVESVRSVQLPLESLLGEKVQLDTAMQDSSHFAELVVYDRPGGGNRYEAYVAVRFSAFGHFFTVWGLSSLRPLPDELRARVAELVGSFGFVYAPTELLAQPYTGKFFRDWWLRYFDFI
ncbi:MAG TPA: hypothetical protein VNT99_20360 [Methylomirabilota bacterium]|nr:hypothetical protein [Methylomirabilota bacterium]